MDNRTKLSTEEGERLHMLSSIDPPVAKTSCVYSERDHSIHEEYHVHTTSPYSYYDAIVRMIAFPV